MELTVLGSSGGCPARGNPASGYLVSTADSTVWLDAGNGTFQQLVDRIDPGVVDALVISHIHPDHCADLFGFYAYMAYGPSGTIPVPVYLPEGAAAHLASFLRAGDEHLLFSVLDMCTVTDGDEITVGDMRMRFATTLHPVPTIATRVDAGGRSLAYSADTGPGGGFPDLATGVDLMLCEATFQGDDPGYPYHLTASEAGALASRLGAAELMLTHISPTLDPAQSIADAAAGFGRVPLYAVPGETTTI